MTRPLVWRCHECGETFIYWSRAQAHADETHHGRIDISRGDK